LKTLILGSSSRYRRALLERLRVPFQIESPDVDESPLPGEAPSALALRLALLKAQAVSANFPTAHVIGSDQVLELEGEPIGKPHTAERAREQLARLSGKSVFVHTGVAVCAPGFARAELVSVEVKYRVLSAAQIARYVELEMPLDCAASTKSEALGSLLLESVNNSDPSALVGLPIFQTINLLRASGYEPWDYCA
jgi:septum formation protein